MDVIEIDIAIVGAGGAGLRAAIAVAEADPSLTVALISKVYPMRSHTVAAEGGAAGVIKDNDSLDNHFHDTVSGGDWLCDQDAVELFVNNAPLELLQLEHWGCPWSREAEWQGRGAAVRRHEDRAHLVRRRQDRLPHAAHAVPDLAEVSLDQALRRILFDRSDRRGRALHRRRRDRDAIGPHGCVPRQGGRSSPPAAPAASFRSPPTAPSRPATAWPWPIGPACRSRTWSSCSTTRPDCPAPASSSPKDRAAKAASWSTRTATATCRTTISGRPTPGHARRRWSSARATVCARRSGMSNGRAAPSRPRMATWCTSTSATWAKRRSMSGCRWCANWRKPMSASIPVHALIPVRPVVHYTMGGIHTDIDTATSLPGLFAAGECACVSINGANRLGSNSLAEILVFGARAGRSAAAFAKANPTLGAAGKAGETAQAAPARTVWARGRQRHRLRLAQGDERHHGKRRRHLSQRGHAAADLRAFSRIYARAIARCRCRIAATSSTPT